MKTTRDDMARDLAESTYLSHGEAWALLARVNDNETLARSLVATGQAFNVTPWTVIMRMEGHAA